MDTAHSRLRTTCYISGPLTSSGKPEENLAAAVEAHKELTRLGYSSLCPHLTWHIDPHGETPHEVWMEIDTPWVLASDCLLRLPGESRGADHEVQVAKEAGIPVFDTLDDLREWSADREQQAIYAALRRDAPSVTDAVADNPDTVKFSTGAVRSSDAEATRYDLVTPIGLRRVAEAYAEGARKYSAHNCEKGMPIHDLLNHAIRHAYLYLSGDRSEDHLGHAAWGFMMACHSEELWPDLNEGTLRGPGCTAPKAG